MFSDIRKTQEWALDPQQLMQISQLVTTELPVTTELFDLDAYRIDYEIARFDYLRVLNSQS
jgi:hypothetical protein